MAVYTHMHTRTKTSRDPTFTRVLQFTPARTKQLFQSLYLIILPVINQEIGTDIPVDSEQIIWKLQLCRFVFWFFGFFIRLYWFESSENQLESYLNQLNVIELQLNQPLTPEKCNPRNSYTTARFTHNQTSERNTRHTAKESKRLSTSYQMMKTWSARST